MGLEQRVRKVPGHRFVARGTHVERRRACGRRGGREEIQNCRPLTRRWRLTDELSATLHFKFVIGTARPVLLLRLVERLLPTSEWRQTKPSLARLS